MSLLFSLIFFAYHRNAALPKKMQQLLQKYDDDQLDVRPNRLAG